MAEVGAKQDWALRPSPSHRATTKSRPKVKVFLDMGEREHDGISLSEVSYVQVSYGSREWGIKNLSDVAAPGSLGLPWTDLRTRSPCQPWLAGVGAPAYSLSSKQFSRNVHAPCEPRKDGKE